MDYTVRKGRSKLSKFLSNLTAFLPLSAAVFTPILLAGPLALYANNYAEFHASLPAMALVLAPYLLIIPLVAILFALVDLLKPFTVPVLLWLAVALYIQGNFLIWDYGSFDGSAIKWQEHALHGVIDYTVWIILALTVFLLRKALIANSVFIASLLVLLQLFVSSLEFFNSNATLATKVPTKNTSRSTESLYSFSKERNILFILLDEFSSRAFYSSLLKSPELQSEWRDFTFYRDTTAVFPTTYPSIPAILTGKPINPDGSMVSYLAETIPNSLPAALQKKGFYSDLVTFHPLCGYANFDSCQPLDQAINKDANGAIKKELLKLLDLALFRYTPNSFKKAIHNDQLWFLQNDGLSNLVPNHRYSLQFAEMFSKKADTNADKPTFKFLHFLIPHGPYTINSDCTKLQNRKFAGKTLYLHAADCALSIADRVVATLKNLGIYNQTTIFIIADHGTPIQFNNPGFGEKIHMNLHRAYPLFMVKAANYLAAQGATINISSEPKSLIDIVRTADQIENLALEPSVLPKKEDSAKRVYYSYAWKHSNWFDDKLPKMSKFEIYGDSWDFKSWKKAVE